jgi:Fe-S cluster assembly protein SufD
MAENMKKTIDWYKSGFEKFEQNLNGQANSEIHIIRKNAFQTFYESGFPTTRMEEWKYTNVEPIANTEFSMEFPEAKIQMPDIEKFFIKGLDCFKIIFVDGKFDQNLSDSFDSEKDFEVHDLNDYLNGSIESDSLQLSQLADFKIDSFVALNTAFMQNGIVIQVKKNKIIEKPFFLLFVSGNEGNNHLNQPRILIDAKQSSGVSIIESFQSINSNVYFSNVVTEFQVEENARVEHIKIQNQADSTYHISNMFSNIAANSYFKTLDINIGGKITRNNIYTNLTGEGSETILNGIYVGNGTQHIDSRTVIEHKEPNCLSNEIYKGIVGDKARGVFNGKIHVYQKAQKTNAIQSNSGLLLTDDAVIDTKPQLEIYADDVRCTHGATIGQLDEDALFYLRARGIGYQQARKMLINAFAGEVIDHIENEILRAGIQEYIDDKLKMIA